MTKMQTIEVKIAETLEDLEAVYAVRRKVFMMDDDNEPEEEQFDGNDLVATHLLAMMDGNVVGTMRLRIISAACGGVMIWERLSILREVRESNPWVFKKLVNAAQEYRKMMGVESVIGIVENPRLMAVWRRMGFHQTGEQPLVYRGHKYVPMAQRFGAELKVEELPSLREAVLTVPKVFSERQLLQGETRAH
ncbi:hypothetical protein [Aestuariispira ectoiniformans]|uniref:hypothetical protein n=1 Tax=Aestuariispira ectoiniformans TaxID=2775080 RepID=UPI00223AFEEB|nr:hypothetical protein [Aestuariispira ectoiniformans]